MNAGLDTSIVVRLLIGTPTDQCRTAWNLVQTEHENGRTVLVSDLVVAETYFVLRHHYAVPAAEAVAGIAALLHDPRFIGQSAVGLLSNANADRLGTDFVDALIHHNYADHDRVLITFDKGAARRADARQLKVPK